MQNQAKLSPSWKQEVNERIAAHKNRKSNPAAEAEAFPQEHHTASQRAAAAAARVAARFAHAPSYSEQLEIEARAAVRAAEAVSRAAREAQAAAESVLAGLEAARTDEPEWEMHTGTATIDELEPTSATGKDHRELLAARQDLEDKVTDRQPFEIRWEPDMPARSPELGTLRKRRGDRSLESKMNDWQEDSELGEEVPGHESIKVVEAALPIHANLIEFPREIIATRKVRPRRAEGPYASELGTQISIFEVDPGAISIDPAPVDAMEMASAPAWSGAEWSGIELDAQPETDFLRESHVQLPEDPIIERKQSPVVDQAPLNLRLMATVVDAALILGTLLVFAVLTVGNVKVPLSLREIEAGSATGLLIVGSAYMALFYAFVSLTPGMKYAGISLTTIGGGYPTRRQRLSRLVALLLSVLPVGLGVVWAIFDEDHLSWHDRLSQTYLRRT
ncbi:MAG TPA: RDD family protein [Terracidiphilus sp.]|nr:RDD family protein [Terracidiphilus sp.]